MSNILIITDSAKLILEKIFYKCEQDNQYYIHSINTSAESILHAIHCHQKYKNIQISAIDNIKINQRAENEAREYYLKLIRDLPNKKIFDNKSFTDLLTKNNRNYWWYLPVSEKNIWTDNTIHRLYEIKRLKYILNNNDYAKIYCCIDDSILQDSFTQMASIKRITFIRNVIKIKNIQRRFALLLFCITYYINASKVFISVLIKKLLLLNYRESVNSVLEINSVGIFSYFPFFWKDLDTDQPRNIFLNRLPYEIAKTYNVTHIIWLSPWKKLIFNRNYLQKLKINNNICILDKIINIKDVLSLFNLSIFLVLLSILLSKNKVNIGSLDGIKIDDIIFDELYRSFSSSTYFEALLIDRALQKVSIENLKLLIFRLEFQPHERALLYNTKGQVKSVGYQHSALSKNFLNYVFMKDELGTHWNSKNDFSSMPLPEHIFTSGKVGSDFMSGAGYPLKNIDIVGGVRFAEIYNFKKQKSNKIDLRIKYDLPLDKSIIFAPTSLFVVETINMLDSLIFSLKEKQKEYFLILKCHPASNSKLFTRKIGHYLDSNWDSNSYCFIAQSINTYDYILLSDLSVFLGGSLAIEALLLGGNPLVYRPSSNFSHNPISDYLDLVRYAFDRNSMKNEINSFYDQRKDNNQMQVVNDMFNDLNDKPYDKFINKIDIIYNGVI